MNEGIKTIVYVVCAALVGVIAYASRPREADVQDSPILTKPLFEEFKDPRTATRLEIVKVDTDLGQLQRFEVARDKKTDRWTIPSHNGYPADAENQMRDVSLMFIDLKPLGLHTTVAEDHPLCGVVQPSEETASGSAKGVGTLVVMEDRDGSELAQLIIGKAVKGRENQYFARVPGKDAVYVVELTPEKLSTRFEDWIEKDLLQLNAWDIEDLELFDYSVVESVEPGTFGITQRLQVDLKWDASKGEWNLQEMLTFPKGKPTPATLGDDEKLNAQKLNDLKSALDDLEIVDVFRKPEGMRADLRADKEFANNREAFRSLFEKGFYPFSSGDEAEIKSANGEIHVGMKDGVDYILRFGDTVQGTGENLNRFLFVMAQFDESKFPMPERPAGLEDAAPSATSGAESGSDQPTDEQAPEDSAEPSSPDTADDTGASPPGACQAEEETEETEEASSDESAAQPPEASDIPQPSGDAAAQPFTQTPGSEGAESQREILEKEYQRKLDEREENIKKGKQRVAELNARFADWYYVISEDIYKKVHLSRADIIMAADGTEASGVDAFRQMQEQGLTPQLPGTP